MQEAGRRDSSLWIREWNAANRILSANRFSALAVLRMTWERSDVAAALAAVDDPAGTGDPGGAGRGKEGDDGGNFFGGVETAERNVLLDEAGHAFGVFLLPLPPGPAGRRD